LNKNNLQQPFPLQSIRLTTTPTARLHAFEWNPEMPEMFAAACTDGTLTTMNVTPVEVNILMY
jgi:hypothetical protein